MEDVAMTDREMVTLELPAKTMQFYEKSAQANYRSLEGEVAYTLLYMSKCGGLTEDSAIVRVPTHGVSAVMERLAYNRVRRALRRVRRATAASMHSVMRSLSMDEVQEALDALVAEGKATVEEGASRDDTDVYVCAE